MLSLWSKLSSIRGKIFLLALLFILGSFSIAYLTFSISNKNMLLQQVATANVLMQRTLSVAAPEAIRFSDSDALEEMAKKLVSTGLLAHIEILDTNGTVLLSHGELNKTHSKDNVFTTDIYYTLGFFGTSNSDQVREVKVGTASYQIDSSFLQEQNESLIETQSHFLLAFFFLMTPLVYFVIRSITKRITLLKKSIDAFGKGLYNMQPVDENHSDEISVIHRDLNKVATKILHMNEELRSRSDELAKQVTIALDAKQEALRANQKKDTFVKNVTHELKHPIAGAVSSIDLSASLISAALENLYETEATLKDETNSSKNIDTVIKELNVALSFIDLVDINSRKASFLIDEIIYAIEHIYVGIELHPQNINFSNVLELIVKNYSLRCESKDIEFIHSINWADDTSEQWVLFDTERWMEVLDILVRNAIQFTNNGSVKLIVRLNVEGSNLSVNSKVVDTGVGIKEEDVASLFEIFQIGEDPTKKELAGVGTGLAVAKTIANSLGGELSLSSSEVGKGSTFEFNCLMPITSEVEPLLKEKKVSKAITKHILYVDDSKTMRLMFEHWCIEKGMKVTLAKNGEEGFKLYQKLHKELDLLAVDCYMPVMNGYEMVERIREFEKQEKLNAAYIYAVTADNSQENKNKCLKAGYSEFLPKPFVGATFDKFANASLSEDEAC